MNSSFGFLIIGLILAFFVLLLTSSSQSEVPYSFGSKSYSTYEPMEVLEKQETEQVYEMEGEGDNEGFEPIVNYPKSGNYGPFRDSEIIDKFSQVNTNGIDGVNGCISSGLSNAGGYICLTPELIDLLKTRGGNASGKCK